MAIDITKTRLGDYQVIWSTYDFGAVDKVTPDITWTTKPIKVGSIGDVELGARLINLAVKIQVECREISLATIKKILPWYGSGTSVPLTPGGTVHKDMYDYAALLRLHPIDISDASEDLVFSLAVPTMKPMDRDGNNDDKMVVTFMAFPDRTQLPQLVYGYFGIP